MNRMIITGRIGSDIELKTSSNGNEYAKIRVAVNRRKKKDEKEVKTDWFNVALFGKTAVFVQTYFKKGDGIELEGRMENNQYDKDGQKRDWWELVVENVEFPKASGKGEKKPEQPTDGFTPADDLPF